MPILMEYRYASKDFDAFLRDVRDSCMLQTHHQGYHTLRAVLHVFRSHLTVQDALTFANILPPVVRAIFVSDWTISRDPKAFPSRDKLQKEVKAVCQDHNLAPDSAIEDVAAALRRAINTRDLDQVLKSLPPDAAAFWQSP